ncbi:DUF805 domain-containing protein [Vagococcus hydrophili]|uniref:DUF805 domain-containing protein n=1 Tax=Vagococcus hydrophili TaxID=2714947 RepID=A0A6G8AT21_9ENTE|nr:DUF805 domain-containing protein [Vagococcus hydrophili]QIL48119.1 DUF805 domain-containing protein [Vagococcus hydrophili]
MLNSYQDYWKKYVDFGGRSTLADYWWVVLCNFIVGILLFMLLVISYGGINALSDDFNPMSLIVVILSGLFFLATIIPNISLVVRRLRDAGFHWGLIFLNLIPYIGSLVVFILCQFPTKEPISPNDFYNQNQTDF